MKVIIIGNHAAGLSAAETLRQVDKSLQIVMISKEDVPPYSRCLIPYMVSGEKGTNDILFRARTFYRDNSIETMFGIEAVRVLPDSKKVLLGSGEKIGYDALIIATGGSPSLPNISGIEKQGVYGFRTLADAEQIAGYCDGVETAIVLGGGLVGLKAALGVHGRGKTVKVVVGSPNVLSQIVSRHEAEIFEAYLAEMGMEILTGTNPSSILGKERVEGIETTEGKRIKGELVIVGKGVRANMDLVKDSNIRIGHGIIVDDHCRTSATDVYAAGDVAQSIDTVRNETWTNALWPHAVEEGRVAAENILGRDAVLGGRTSMNSFVIGELPLITCGLTGAREHVEGAEEVTMRGPGKNQCRRFVLKDGRLVGFALVGAVADAGVLCSLVRKAVKVTEQAKERILAGEYDFASLFLLIRANPDKFKEPEYQEVFSFT